MRTFRLRIDDRIVGYQRLEGKSYFYSKDNFWWNGKPIEYNTQDRFTGLKDKNDRTLFEHDIVKVRFKNPLRKDRDFRIRYRNNDFQLVELETEMTESFQLLDKAKTIEFVSFTFINTDFIFKTGKS